VLPGISTEQLRSRLNRMVADGMLTRKRYREVPPRVDYELTERARELMPVLGELARWGYEWAWSSPRNTESVDLGAIFRLAPGLVERSESARMVEFVVTDSAGGEPECYTFTISEHGVTVAEQPAERADARVTGDRSAWISTFAPDHDRHRLQVAGDANLAIRLLEALGAEGRPVSARVAA
jgi:hypothetical protein